MSKRTNDHVSSLFLRISEEKRQKILDIAIEEFANNGYKSANVNRIAENAGISVGSLYKYFGTKENLFLHIVEDSALIIEKYTQEALNSEAPILTKVQKLLYMAHEYSIEEPHIIKLYDVFTSDNDEKRASIIAEKLEGITSSAYTKLIADAQKSGEVRSDIDPRILAFMIDNQLMVTQFSFANSYYSRRLKLYLENDDMTDISDEQMIEEILLAIKNILEIE